jgi:hypothetical protein
VKGRAVAYGPVVGGAWRINVWNNDIVGQGGLMTTVEELQKWDENFYTGTVGGRGFLARQLERGKLTDGKTLTYAFGLEVLTYRGLPLVEHSGSTGGYRTDISRFPAQHTSVVTMCNVSNADAVGLAHRVADVVLGSKFTQPVPPAATRASAQQAGSTVMLSDSERAALVGRYFSDELSSTYDLRASGSALILTRGRSAPDTLRVLDHETLRAGGEVIWGAGARFSTLHLQPSTRSLARGIRRGYITDASVIERRTGQLDISSCPRGLCIYPIRCVSARKSRKSRTSLAPSARGTSSSDPQGRLDRVR